MVMSALDSFMTKVSWAPLDVLVIDMPPGTGNVYWSLTCCLTYMPGSSSADCA